MSRDSMIGRVMELLDAVAEVPGTNRPALAKATGLPPATCNRIVKRLIAERLLADGTDGLRLGLRLFELGTHAAQAGVTLLDVVGPYLVDLHAALGWTAQLGVLDGNEVVYLLKIGPGLDTRVAGRFPPHCTGAGKVLLAFSPPETVERVLEESALLPRTQKSITDKEILLNELRATKRRGYAIDREEFQDGMTGVAVPMKPGAITLTGPTGSFDAPRAAHALRVVAQLIESRIRRA